MIIATVTIGFVLLLTRQAFHELSVMREQATRDYWTSFGRVERIFVNPK